MISHYVRRYAESAINHSIKSPFVTAILGPRRVGKSTLVRHCLADITEDKKLLLNMDSLSTRQRVEQLGLRSIIEEDTLNKITPSKKMWVAIDEAQKCPLLFEQIKLLYDEFKDQNALKFVVTGSGSLNLHQLSAETLAGRVNLHHLRPFNLKESCTLRNNLEFTERSVLGKLINQDIADIEQHCRELSPYRKVLQQSLQEQLIFGGLPEVLLLEDDNDRLSYLANYLQTYLEKDILPIKTVADLKSYQNLMTVIAEQTGSIRDDTKILNTLGCSRNTLKKYRDILAATLMYEEVYPFVGSTLKRLIKAPKSYLIDNGIISYLTNITDFNMLNSTGLIGHRFENWALKELQIINDQNPRRSSICFWRTRTGTEVDFVLQYETYIIPIEITYSNQIDQKKHRTLKHFLQDETKAPYGIFIYQGDFKYDRVNRIYHLPGWMV